MSLNLDVPDAFLMNGLGLQFWGTKTTELKCHFHHVITGADTVNKTLLMWTLITGLRQCLLGFSPGRLLFFSPFPYCSFRRKSLCTDCNKGVGSFCSVSLRVEDLHYLVFFCMGVFGFTPTCICLCSTFLYQFGLKYISLVKSLFQPFAHFILSFFSYC